MRVFILSLLAVSSVHSHAIRYPYHGQLLSYAPARGEFPVYNDLAQGYVRYFDSNGAERLVRYNYPEPLYGVRRYSYSYGGNDGNQLLRTYGGAAPESGFSAESYYQIQDSNELAKAREEHFRRWCEQRYQALKTEIERMRAEGLKPSSDMMAQLQPLEKIISSTTYTAIGESPEIQRIRDEHLRIWNEARLKVLQQEADHLRFNHGIKETTTHTTGSEFNANLNAVIGETNEQKKAREEHLRIHNEHLEKLKQIEAEHKLQHGNLGVITVKESSQAYGVHSEVPNFAVKSGYEHIAHEQTIQPNAPIADTPENIKAREEHLRLYNEQLEKVKQVEAEQKLQQSIGVKEETQTYGIQQEAALKSSFHQQAVQQQQTASIADTPEVIKAREEHLRLVNEAKLRAQAEGSYNAKDDGSYKAEYHTGYEKIEQKPDLRYVPALQQPVQPIQNIAILQMTQPANQGIQQQQSSLLKTSDVQPVQQQPTPVQDTPEVIRAREEHLRIVNEVKLKAAQSQQEMKEIETKTASTFQQADKAQTYIASSIDDAEKLREEERLREEQRLKEAERLREAERMREEEKMREMERLREIERQKEEEKMLEAERLRLKAEEEKRLQMERLEEEKRLREATNIKDMAIEQSSGSIGSGISSESQGGQWKAQGFEGGSSSISTGASLVTGNLLGSQLKTQQAQGFESGSSSISTTGHLLGSQLKTQQSQGFESGISTSGGSLATGSSSGTGFVLSSQYKNNPYLIRFAAQPGTTAYIIGEQQQAGLKSDIIQPNLYYLPSSNVAQKEAPLYLRYTQSGLHSPNAVQQLATATLTTGGVHEIKPIVKSSEKISTYASSASSSSGSSSSSNLKVSYGTDTAALTELEKATRDHFRAHELALEQLRLANVKTPYNKDCN